MRYTKSLQCGRSATLPRGKVWLICTIRWFANLYKPKW